MRPGDVWGGATPSTAAVLEMADGLRGHDPHLAAALVEHAIRLGGGDPSVRHAADLTSARALAERDAPAELALRYAPQLTAAREDGRAADEVAWRVLLANAALELSDAQIARDLLADVDEDAVPEWCRAALGVLRAQERAVAGDVEGCDAAARTVGPGRGAALDLLRARAAARAVSGDVGGALELLGTATTNDPAPTEPDADGGRRAATLAADQVALLLDRGDVRAALDLAGPYLEAAPGPATAVAIGRLADDVARRIHLPAGDGERAMALAARVENDLTARGRPAAAARAGLVLAEAAETAGDLPRALSALRRAHAHELDARDSAHAAIRSLAAVTVGGGHGVASGSRARPGSEPVNSGGPPGLDAGLSGGDPDRRPADDPSPPNHPGTSAAARPAGREHRLERTETVARTESARREVPDAGPGTSDGSGSPRTGAGTGGRRRRDEDTRSTDFIGGPHGPRGRHGRSDDTSPTGTSRTDPAPSAPRPAEGTDLPIPPSPGDGPAPRGATPSDVPPAPDRSREELTPAALPRTGGGVTTSAVPRWDGSSDLDAGRPHHDPADEPDRSTGGGEMSALDTLHRNALRLEILLGRTGGTGTPTTGPRARGGTSTTATSSPAGTGGDRALGAEPPSADPGVGPGSTSGPRSTSGPGSTSGPVPGSTIDSALERGTAADLDDELPLTLVDLLAEYDLPDVGRAAARTVAAPEPEHPASVPPSRPSAIDPLPTRNGRESTGDRGTTRWDATVSSDPVTKDDPGSGVGAGPAGAARPDPTSLPVGDPRTDRSGADRASGTGRADGGGEADPGVRLADLLAEAMDAFRRTEPRASQPPSVPSGRGDGRSPR